MIRRRKISKIHGRRQWRPTDFVRLAGVKAVRREQGRRRKCQGKLLENVLAVKEGEMRVKKGWDRVPREKAQD